MTQWMRFNTDLRWLLYLQKRRNKLEEQIEFQNKNEREIDSQINNLEMKSDDLERKAASYALSIDDLNKDNEYDTSLYNKNRRDMMKKKAENHSINAIQRKFYTQFFKQKEKIEEMLLNYNSSIESYKNSIIEEGRESELNDKITEINIKQHPLIAEINQILNNLKESLPKISSKLPWDKPRFYQNTKSNNFNNFQEQNRSRIEYPTHKTSKSEDYVQLSLNQNKIKNANGVKKISQFSPNVQSPPSKFENNVPSPFLTEPPETKTLLKGGQNTPNENMNGIEKQMKT